MQYFMHRYACVSSTNTLLRRMADDGAPEGTVVLADAQTAGRGRMGRQFYSPDGGLYMSVLLRPAGSAARALGITTRAAVAVAKVIERHTGRAAAIKWVNDVYQNGKKVCGILTEGKCAPDGSLVYAVLGIGVNLCLPSGGFDESIRDSAGAIFAPGEDFDREAFAHDILHAFFGCGEDCYEEYARRSMLTGKTVTAFQGGVPLCSGTVLGIDRDFALRLRLPNGSEATLHSGEVSVREA